MKSLNIGLEHLDLVLNSFSSISTALTSFFVFKISKLYFGDKKSLLVSILYSLMPYVWFHAINAEVYAFYGLVVSIWFYCILMAVRNKNEKMGIVSSMAFVLVWYAHIISAPLIVCQIYFLRKINKEFKWMIKNLVLITILSLFYVVNLAIPSTREAILGIYHGTPVTLYTLFFMLPLTGWEFIMALSFGLFLLLIYSIITMIRKKHFDELNKLFLLVLLLSSGAFFVTSPTPIIGYTSTFVLIPIISLRYHNKKIILIPVFLLLLIKFLPIAYQFHIYDHPHYQYAMWLEKNFGDKNIITGHDKLWIRYYTNVSVEPYDTDPSKETIVTSHYFINEYRMEWIEFTKLFPFLKPLNFEKVQLNPIYMNNSYEKIATFPYMTREFNDYQVFMSVKGNVFEKMFLSTDYAQPEYDVYRIKSVRLQYESS